MKPYSYEGNMSVIQRESFPLYKSSRMQYLNPFYATGLFLYNLKNLRKPLVFRCFQGV